MRIRKFNESNSNGLDISYFKFIFSEFLDEGSEGFNRGDGEIEDYYEIFIKEPILKTHSINFDSYESNIKELYDFSKNLKSCVERVKEEYPDIKVEFQFEDITVEKKSIEREIHLIFTI